VAKPLQLAAWLLLTACRNLSMSYQTVNIMMYLTASESQKKSVTIFLSETGLGAQTNQMHWSKISWHGMREWLSSQLPKLLNCSFKLPSNEQHRNSVLHAYSTKTCP